ncbi:hypothetical protein Msi02_49480 [Microbispora siamensis]|uniref:Uncharacterized protein n=1 Tax=Microbispora siamensis TaxID=564413 RepID=A0ABQ4GRS8_9ACTN|nr:hypothetical protein Msi02_49480 [Microbispora siamensis]
MAVPHGQSLAGPVVVDPELLQELEQVVEEEKGLRQRATQVATTEVDAMKTGTGTGLKPYADVCGCGVVHG